MRPRNFFCNTLTSGATDEQNQAEIPDREGMGETSEMHEQLTGRFTFRRDNGLSLRSASVDSPDGNTTCASLQGLSSVQTR